jgi:hypothetical protein
MRASFGLLAAIVTLFIGVQALSIAGQNASPTVQNASNTTQYTYNMSTGIFEAVGTAASPAIVWGGVAAFIVLALGLLYVTVGGGR